MSSLIQYLGYAQTTPIAFVNIELEQKQSKTTRDATLIELLSVLGGAALITLVATKAHFSPGL